MFYQGYSLILGYGEVNVITYFVFYFGSYLGPTIKTDIGSQGAHKSSRLRNEVVARSVGL